MDNHDEGTVRVDAKARPGHWLYEWEDETSSFDPEGYWDYGPECYMRTYRAWLPNKLKGKDESTIQEYVADHSDDPHMWA